MVQPRNFPSLEQIIDRQPLTVTPETPLIEVIRRMQQWANSCHLTNNDSGSEADFTGQINNSCALVIKNSQLQGIFTERDLVKIIAAERDLAGIAVDEVMSQELITLTATGSQDIFTVVSLFRQHPIRHLPIIDEENSLLGLVTEKNLRQALQPMNLMKWRRVKEIMNSHVIHALPTISVRHAAQLMAKHQVSYVAIVESAQEQNELLIPVGIITERDIVQFKALNLDLTQPVQRLMSTPLFLVSPQDSLWSIHQQMQQRRVRRLLVAGSQGELQGIITQTSLLQLFNPAEMYELIEVLQRQVCQLELEKVELLQNQNTELEKQVRERTSELTKSIQQLQQEKNQRQQSDLRFRAIFDQAFQFIGLMKPDGTLIEANQTALDFGGLTLKDVANKPFWEARWWTISKKTQESLKKAISKAALGEFVRYEVDVLGKNDRIATIDFSIKPIKDQTGRIVMLIPEGRDITEQKQLEAQFFRTQRLESLGTLASGIAHDLNNILTPILAFARLIPLKLPQVDEQTQEFFQIIETNAQRGAALVKQILTFARGVEGERGIVQMRHLIAEVRKIVVATFPKTIELDIDTPKNLWTVNADANQLHQILMNLVVNGRDAMPDGGKLSIKAENFVVDADYAKLHLNATEGSYLLITVADTGVGIAPEIIDRIFEPFFTTKEIGKGTGLGLSTVIGIVKSHHGFVDVISKSQQGTQVKVFLPASETALRAMAEIEPLPQGNGEVILVVDDEISILEVTKATLETYNYKVLTASNGIEAIAIYVQNQNALKLVVMDIMMPSMDGKTAIRTLTQINPDVKILAVSGLISSPEIISEIEQKISNFLVKPYTNDELLRIINKLITTN